ncbi:quinone oxidoreductase family protein [Streptosporangium roseum]|uniref:Dehydrogenase/oxidoreductase n=1 Tax=Streptosporangium roseum (strain ATCC 12428 / DSM 43021 / JCM 3005 / KCTC 9067 / NCIMB 10171 / NRRL 2505 / NI 9100) TaxID=479432 RepID=D2BFB7_STRRD|nr:NADPH:quinone oxidoreductase family protein [Streptosporangium roseum]ACZ88275.1 putative dehydrogenase/oxidoreductase [Streptosporangium roseum DSM 43021]
MRAIQITRTGGPEVLTEVELPDPEPAPGHLLVEVEAAGVNFADTARVAGAYLPPELPFVPGGEVVGRTADGRRVMGLAQRGYASRAVVDGEDAVELPEGIGAGVALALLVQGLTAWHLIRSAARVLPGESVVVNSAAGGVGHLAVQLARESGAGRVIATASSEDKRALALSLGADAAVDGRAEGYAERVIEANLGHRADVVLDAVGGPVFDAALGAVAEFGRLVSYGFASGRGPSPIDVDRLTELNFSVAGFWVRPAIRLPGGYKVPLKELLGLTASGRLRPLVGGEYALSDARRAHEDMLARRTTGKIILRP